MNQATSIKIDSSRLEYFVARQQRRAEEISNFMTSRLNKLSCYTDRINQFAKAVKATDFVLGNMYSTDIGDKEYTDVASLICNIKFNAPAKKNTKAAETFYAKKWLEIVGSDLARNPQFRIFKDGITLQIWVK